MWWLLAVGLFVSACNEIYGLDETRVRDTTLDDDHDEVPDDRDNCLGLANRGQEDADADGKGDACDTCDGCFTCNAGPDHDEDGDHHVDGCDNCPAVPNPDLANADGDDLGDACDPDNTTQQRRLLFDGFLTIADSWMRIGEWGADGAARTIDGPHPYGWRLTEARLLLDGVAAWRLETEFVVPASPQMFDSIGAHIVDAAGMSRWGCTILFDTGMWTLTNGIPAAVAISPGTTTTMHLASRRGGTSTHYCTVRGNPEKANATGPDTYPLGIQLYATRMTQFEYVELIDGL